MYMMSLLQKSQFCHSRSDSERESGSNYSPRRICLWHDLKNHIRPRVLLKEVVIPEMFNRESGLEPYPDKGIRG